MPIANGRGDANKRRILRDFRLNPVLHTRPLNGKALRCCCGNKVEDRYYLFDAVDRSANKAVDVLYAGDSCANRFLELSGDAEGGPIPALPFFDPLQAKMRPRTYGVHAGGPATSRAKPALINVEVEQVIMLTLICWNTSPKPGGVFSVLLDEIRRFPTAPLFDKKIKSVNTAIGASGQRLSTMLQQLKATNTTLREYAFPEMEEALQRLGVVSNL